MPSHPFNVIAELPELTWMDLPAVPCRDASYSMGNRLPESEIPYLNAAAHDWTGRRPTKFTATLLFLNNLSADANLYPATWNKWREKLLPANVAPNTGGAVGTLLHPDIGEIDCRVESADVTLEAGNRSGVTVRVTWVESLKEVPPKSQATDAPTLSLEALALKADQLMVAHQVDYPSGMPTMNLVGLAKAFTGTLNMLDYAAKGLSLTMSERLNTILSLDPLTASEMLLDATAAATQEVVDASMNATAAIVTNVSTVSGRLKKIDPAGALRKAFKPQTSAKEFMRTLRKISDSLFKTLPADEFKEQRQSASPAERSKLHTLQTTLDQMMDVALMEASKSLHQEHMTGNNLPTSQEEADNRKQVEAARQHHFTKMGIGSFVTVAPSYLDEIANIFGNSISDVLQLNPVLLGVQLVPKDVTVYYYLGKTSGNTFRS